MPKISWYHNIAVAGRENWPLVERIFQLVCVSAGFYLKLSLLYQKNIFISIWKIFEILEINWWMIWPISTSTSFPPVCPGRSPRWCGPRWSSLYGLKPLGGGASLPGFCVMEDMIKTGVWLTWDLTLPSWCPPRQGWPPRPTASWECSPWSTWEGEITKSILHCYIVTNDVKISGLLSLS